MNRIGSLLIVLLFATSVSAADNPWDTKLPFKNAIVKSKITGSMKGVKTLYVKDYGRTRAEYSTTTMKMLGMTTKQNDAIITTPDWQYNIDFSENTGTKQTNPKKYLIQEFNNLSKSDQKKVVKNAESQGISTIAGIDAEVEKNFGEIMGYQCDKVSMSGMVSYTITGTDLPLKIIGDTMGVKINQYATNIDKKAPPSSKFKLPPNIVFMLDKETDRMMQNQAKATIRALLDGESAGGYKNEGQQTSGNSTQDQNKEDGVLEQDAKDVAGAAKQETKDATIEEVQEGIRTIFKSIFD